MRLQNILLLRHECMPVYLHILNVVDSSHMAKRSDTCGPHAILALVTGRNVHQFVVVALC